MGEYSQDTSMEQFLSTLFKIDVCREYLRILLDSSEVEISPSGGLYAARSDKPSVMLFAHCSKSDIKVRLLTLKKFKSNAGFDEVAFLEEIHQSRVLTCCVKLFRTDLYGNLSPCEAGSLPPIGQIYTLELCYTLSLATIELIWEAYRQSADINQWMPYFKILCSELDAATRSIDTTFNNVILPVYEMAKMRCSVQDF